MFGLSPMEMMIFAVIVLVLFGSRLPKIMRSLGSSVTEFKKGVNEGEEHDAVDESAPRPEKQVEEKR